MTIQFYRVGLACEAASGIGCGIRAKPILHNLEADEAIAGAWLHRSGTILAVCWQRESDEDLGSITAAFTAEQCICAEKVIDAQERRALLDAFERREGWYRGAQVDELSAEEATIIAGRVVQRVQAKAALGADEAARLASSIAEACSRILTTEAPGTSASREARLSNAILDAGRVQLGDAHYGALQEALANGGHRPLPDER